MASLCSTPFVKDGVQMPPGVVPKRALMSSPLIGGSSGDGHQVQFSRTEGMTPLHLSFDNILVDDEQKASSVP